MEYDKRKIKFRVLGHSAGTCRGCPSMSALVDDDTLLDAGTGAAALYASELDEVSTLLLTHAHLDHIALMCFIADYRLNKGLKVYCSEHTRDVICEHILNDKIWPSMHKIIIRGTPIIQFEIIKPFETFLANGRRYTPIPVEHTTETFGFCIHSERADFVWFADFGGADQRVYDYINGLSNLKYLTIEASFPNDKAQLADDSKHLTPETLRETLTKIKAPDDLEIYICHIKPRYEKVIVQELNDLRDPRIAPLQAGQLFTF